ncbi:protein FAM151B isoform X2 [Nylanderia fulva]|uniref:protein FAM151B isoform X2 n=1 Tax=Nylanderia fulva TaxID=613905 RepID=UPI0010FB84AF|nr:protein FAM151B isoform X2 [Nylanderia fulva]
MSYSKAAMCDDTSNKNAGSSSHVAPDPNTFFPAAKDNLTKIVWAHAVNDQKKLNEALAKEYIMMLEADVVVGKLNGTTDLIPIMAHPPHNVSDLSLENFLDTIIRGQYKNKGIKLDFKTTEAFNLSKPILEKLRKSLTFPVFLNADIIPGPVNATNITVNAEEFLKGANKTLPESILSVGWTTRYGKEFNLTKGQYNETHIQKMIKALKENHVSQSVTYPVRAGLVVNNVDIIKKLLREAPKTIKSATLTIWSADNDEVDAAKLSKFIKEVGVEKVYVDVPEDLHKKLKLSAASAMNSAIINMGFSMALLVLLRML